MFISISSYSCFDFWCWIYYIFLLFLLEYFRKQDELYEYETMDPHIFILIVPWTIVDFSSYIQLCLDGRPRTVWTPDIKETVLQEINEFPETSTRKILRAPNILYQIVWQILVDFFYYICLIFQELPLYSWVVERKSLRLNETHLKEHSTFTMELLFIIYVHFVPTVRWG